jgi:hypothetical protein
MPRPPTGKGSDLLPEGESIRRALTWLTERKREVPTVPLYKLVDEAAIRFDLSPGETQFLLDNWRAGE